MAGLGVNVSYLKTKPGIFRAATVVTGLLAVAFTSAAVAKSGWIQGGGECHVWTCPSSITVELAVSVLILTGIYSVVMLIGSLISKIKRNRVFRKVDTWGNSTSAFLFCMVFGVLESYVIVSLMYKPCDVHLTGSANDIVKAMHRLECKAIEMNREQVFQPILFSFGGVFSFVAGLLAMYTTKFTKIFEAESIVPSMVMTSDNGQGQLEP